MDRILLIFVDGVGLAPAGATNPFSGLPTPALQRLLGGPLTLERAGHGGQALLLALDATLGVDGLPQSATGQTTLFTGVNAAAHIGRHVTGFPGPRLRRLLEANNLLVRCRLAGLEATFANAYTERYFRRSGERRRRHSATTVATMAAGLALRRIGDLERGEAVAWDVVRDRFGRPLRQQPAGDGDGETLSPITPEEAGCHLVELAGRHHLTLWETFLTDLAGHRRFGITPEEAMGRVDGLLAGVLEHRGPELTVVVTSDHGNLEETSHTRHTRNPVPLLAVGPGAESFTGVRSLTGVTPRLLDLLGASPGPDVVPEEGPAEATGSAEPSGGDG